MLAVQTCYANTISLNEAMDAALKQHPTLNISNIHITGAQNELREQSAYAYNPELSIEPQRRRLNGGGSSNDYYITLSQGIELGGKQGYREKLADASLQAVKLSSDAQRQKVQVDVARAVVELYFSKRELLWRNQQAATLVQLNKAITRQMEVGEANQLDVNLTQASLMQAIYADAQAKQLYAMNVSRYFMAVGQADEAKNIQVELPKLAVTWLPLSEPVQIALKSRPDIAVKRQRWQQYSAQADLAKANKVPDLTVGLMTAREAGEQLVSLAFSMPIPLLNSHDGAYRSALSQASAQQVELAWLEQRVKLEVQEAVYHHATAMRSILAAKQFTNTADEESKSAASPDRIKLATTAFDAGELNIEELVVHINQILESRINSAAILKQGWLARIRLAEVLGHPEYILQGNQ